MGKSCDGNLAAGANLHVQLVTLSGYGLHSISPHRGVETGPPPVFLLHVRLGAPFVGNCVRKPSSTGRRFCPVSLRPGAIGPTETDRFKLQAWHGRLFSYSHRTVPDGRAAMCRSREPRRGPTARDRQRRIRGIFARAPSGVKPPAGKRRRRVSSPGTAGDARVSTRSVGAIGGLSPFPRVPARRRLTAASRRFGARP